MSNEIARLLGINPATVSYHKRKLGYPMDGQLRRPLRLGSDPAATTTPVTPCVTAWSNLAFRLGAWTFAVRRGAVVARPKALPLEELLAADTPRSRNNVKQRLIAAGLKRNRCEECGISRWRERPLSLCLHHVNGERHDNRLENLVLLCPNCHSQTPNFGSKNCRRRPE